MGPHPSKPRAVRPVSRAGGSRQWTVTLLALVLAGCATGRPTGRAGADNPFNPTEEEPQEIRIEVHNLNFNEARLWAVSGGRRTRLGTVGGNQDAVYRLPWNLSLPLVLEIDLVAGPSCSTSPIQVQPGDRIQLDIESNFRLTRYCR